MVQRPVTGDGTGRVLEGWKARGRSCRDHVCCVRATTGPCPRQCCACGLESGPSAAGGRGQVGRPRVLFGGVGGEKAVGSRCFPLVPIGRPPRHDASAGVFHMLAPQDPKQPGEKRPARFIPKPSARVQELPAGQIGVVQVCS